MRNTIIRCVKYWGCSILAVALVMLNISGLQVEIVYAADGESVKTEQRESITKKHAKEIAKFQVNKTIEQGQSNWDLSTTVKKVYNLYDSEMNLCAYAVEMKEGNKDAGYVVVGANEEQCPIIEFKTSGKFLEETLEQNEYIVCDGKFGYYVAEEDADTVTNIRNERETKNILELEVNRQGKHTDEWENVENQVEKLYGDSTPPCETLGPSAIVHYTGEYERGYTSVRSKFVPSYNFIEYIDMYDFPEDNNCVPIATTNLIKYWHDRKSFDLIDGTWTNTYYKIYDYLGATSKGTAFCYTVDALDRYLFEKGVETGITHYWWKTDTSWNEMKYRLDNGEPFLYALEHIAYHNNGHAVLVVGYTEYTYAETQFLSDSKYSRYLCVVDGYNNYPDRYLNISVGADVAQDEMVTLYFVGK